MQIHEYFTSFSCKEWILKTFQSRQKKKTEKISTVQLLGAAAFLSYSFITLILKQKQLCHFREWESDVLLFLL